MNIRTFIFLVLTYSYIFGRFSLGLKKLLRKLKITSVNYQLNPINYFKMATHDIFKAFFLLDIFGIGTDIKN